MSTFGTHFRVTTFGESHCKGVGCIVDGVPPQLPLTEADIQPQLTRRRPGQSRLTTPRDEKDRVTILSGTEHGRTLGTPVALFVPNQNVRPRDYAEMSLVPRPGHADYTYQAKYGVRASSGGGRSSARETIGRVAAGAIADKWLAQAFGARVVAWVSRVGSIELLDSALDGLRGSAAVGDATGPGTLTREDVDRYGRLRVLRDPATWHRVGGGVAVDADAADSSATSSSTSSSSSSAAAVAAVPSSASESKESADAAAKVAAEQKEVDAVSEAAFVGANSTQDADPFAGDTKPAYEGHDGTVYDRAGNVTAAPAGGIEAWRTDELVHVRCPHGPTAARIATCIRRVRASHDSIGGVITCVCANVPVGLGEPCFDKLEAKLAHGMLSLPATKGFELGSGFEGTRLRGSAHNDAFVAHPDAEVPLLTTKTNNAGGTLGGISSGADLCFKVAVKSVSTIARAQDTADFTGKAAVLEAKGRHDPCVLPRAPPLIEAMGSLVIADAAVGQMARVAAARAMLSAGPSDLTYFPVTSIDTRADPKDREQDGHPAAKRAKTK